MTGIGPAPTIVEVPHRFASPLRGLATLLAIFALVVPGPVTGYHGGSAIGSFLNCDRPGVFPPRCTSVGNDLTHRVFLDASLTPGLAAAVTATVADDYDLTDMRMLVDTELTSATDVIAYSNDYGDIGAAAWVYCPTDAPRGTNADGDRWCRGQEMHFNLNPRYSLFFDDEASRDHVACHEMGHTIGLRHWGNPPESRGPVAATCMNADTPNGPPSLHPNDIDHINRYHYVAPPPSRRMRLLWAPSPGLATIIGTGVEADGGEHFETLREMVRSADAVVLGRVTRIVPGRSFGDPSRSGLQYAAATIEVDDALVAGTLGAGASSLVTLEIPLFDGPESIALLQAELPWPESVFFLRNKGESARVAGLPRADQLADAAYYRLVGFGAAIINDVGMARVSVEEAEFLTALDGSSFRDAVRRVRVAGS